MLWRFHHSAYLRNIEFQSISWIYMRSIFTYFTTVIVQIIAFCHLHISFTDTDCFFSFLIWRTFFPDYSDAMSLYSWTHSKTLHSIVEGILYIFQKYPCKDFHTVFIISYRHFRATVVTYYLLFTLMLIFCNNK